MCEVDGCEVAVVAESGLCAGHLVQSVATEALESSDQHHPGVLVGRLVLDVLGGGLVGVVNRAADRVRGAGGQPRADALAPHAAALAFLRGLGFSPAATRPTREEVEAFRRITARTFHADGGGARPVDPAMMARINQACDVLADRRPR